VFLQSGTVKDNISGAADSKALNSLLCAAFSDSHPINVRRCILDFLHFLDDRLHPTGSHLMMRLRLLTSFSILNPLIFGLSSKSFTGSDQIKDDFEVLRKCLLHIMSSDSVSQSSLVFSMTVRFYLWRTADKFFEGLNVHKSLQILFNLLLNGEISLPGLCAGDLLADMCREPKIANQLSSLQEFKNYLKEIIVQLKAKDTSLVLKLLHLLRCLLDNGADRKAEQHIRDLFFEQQSTEDDPPLEPLDTLFQLVIGPDDLVATAALDLLIRLVASQGEHTLADKENKPACKVPYEWLLESAISGLQSNTIADSVNFRILLESANHQQSIICSRLLRRVLLIRLADRLVQCIQSTRTADVLSTPDNGTLDNVSALVELLFRTVLGQFDGNLLIGILAGNKKPDVTLNIPGPANAKADVESCLLSMGLAVEAMGLVYTCTDMLSTMFPGVSQEDEVSLTQPSNEKTGGDNKPASSVARHCGQSLQTLLECPETPGLFALGLLTTSPTHSSPSDYSALGLGLATRSAIVRLLSVALHLDTFDNEQFALLLHRLQPTDGNITSLLDRISGGQAGLSLSMTSFLSQWVCSAAGGSVQHQFMPAFSFDQLSKSKKRPSESDALEQRIDRFLTDWEADRNTEVPSFASDVLSIFQYKLHLLQSREDALEASASANAEALNQANRLCEYYRERAIIAEAESEQLRVLQLDSVGRIEKDKLSLALLNSQLERLSSELVELRKQLTDKTSECQDLTQKNDNLQTKLNAAREENRAMDATIDDYRNQLDLAKEQIQAQLTQ
ncbi:hypothetical protein X801_04992, partial [Opisthorchis viverrini]